MFNLIITSRSSNKTYVHTSETSTGKYFELLRGLPYIRVVTGTAVVNEKYGGQCLFMSGVHAALSDVIFKADLLISADSEIKMFFEI